MPFDEYMVSSMSWAKVLSSGVTDFTATPFLRKRGSGNFRTSRIAITPYYNCILGFLARPHGAIVIQVALDGRGDQGVESLGIGHLFEVRVRDIPRLNEDRGHFALAENAEGLIPDPGRLIYREATLAVARLRNVIIAGRQPAVRQPLADKTRQQFRVGKAGGGLALCDENIVAHFVSR